MEVTSSTSTTTTGSNHRRKSTPRAGTGSSSSTSTSVAAVSVWESRMKIDQVKGGIKVFNGATEDFCQGSDHDTVNQQQLQRATLPTTTSRRKRLPPLGTGLVGIGKRNTRKVENSDHRNPNQTPKDKSEMQRNSADDDNDADHKISIQVKKTRSNPTPPMAVRSPTLKKTRSDSGKSSTCNTQSTIAGRLRKSKSEPNRAINNNMDESRGPADSSSQDMGDERYVAFQFTKVKSGTDKSTPQTSKISPEISQNAAIGDCGSGHDDNEEEEKETADAGGSTAEDEALKETANGSDNEGSKELGVCQEELISVGSIDVGQVEPTVKLEEEEEDDEDHDDDDDPDDDDVEFVDNEEEEDEEDEEIEADRVNNFDDVIEMDVETEIKDKNVLDDVKKSMIGQVNNNLVNAHSSSPSSIITGKLLPSPNKPTLSLHNFSRPRPSSTPNVGSVIDESHDVTAETHGRLQSLVDLVMWRDVSRSAFVFGLGTFMIISSSYTKDLTISSISVMSYLSLIYLGLIFLYRNILCRGITEDSRQHNVLGEEEAIWVTRLILPYLNEFLLKLRDLFSGDPAMTMKLAVFLFVLARCGSFFTLWKMVKLGFFGVFTVPKVCSSYSSYLKAHGTFWIRRFQDAWESCSHKKAVAVAIFTLVWNLSSVVARVWAAFMLFVAFRYYQQHYMIVKEEQWVHMDGIADGGRERRRTPAPAPPHNQPRARQVGVRQVGQWRTGASAGLRKQKKCA